MMFRYMCYSLITFSITIMLAVKTCLYRPNKTHWHNGVRAGKVYLILKAEEQKQLFSFPALITKLQKSCPC